MSVIKYIICSKPFQPFNSGPSQFCEFCEKIKNKRFCALQSNLKELFIFLLFIFLKKSNLILLKQMMRELKQKEAQNETKNK